MPFGNYLFQPRVVRALAAARITAARLDKMSLKEISEIYGVGDESRKHIRKVREFLREAEQRKIADPVILIRRVMMVNNFAKEIDMGKAPEVEEWNEDEDDAPAESAMQVEPEKKPHEKEFDTDKLNTFTVVLTRDKYSEFVYAIAASEGRSPSNYIQKLIGEAYNRNHQALEAQGSRSHG